MTKPGTLLVVALLFAPLTGCVTTVVTAPVKLVYGAGKFAVKGTAAAVRAVTPDHKKDEQSKDATPEPPAAGQPR